MSLMHATRAHGSSGLLMRAGGGGHKPAGEILYLSLSLSQGFRQIWNILGFFLGFLILPKSSPS